MANVRDLLLDEEEDGFDWKESGKTPSRSARRSLELYLERKALRRQIKDTFSQDDVADELDW